MRNFNIFKYAIIFLLMFAVQSCDEEKVDLDDVENLIEYTVKCDHPDAEVYLIANGVQPEGIRFKGEYHLKKSTKDYFAVVDATCEDADAIIKVNLFVNNKEKVHKSGVSHIKISERLKGQGPYLR